MLKLRTFIFICFACLIFPLLSMVLLLFQYTVRQNTEKYEQQLSNVAAAIVTSVEGQIQSSEDQLHRCAQSMEFLHLGYAKSKDRLYHYASKLNQKLSTEFSGISLKIGAFFYNSYTQYLYADFNGVLSDSLQERVRSALSSHAPSIIIDTELLPYEGGNYLLLIARHQYGSMAVVLDPGKDPTYLANAGTVQETFLFSSNEAGDLSGVNVVPVGESPLFLSYQIPQNGFFQQLDGFQTFLLVMIVVVFILLSSILLLFYLRFYRPLHGIATAFSVVARGNLDYRLKGKSHIEELNLYKEGFNQMMDTIQREQANTLRWQQSSYQQRLEAVHAQLQFLQLQIRPHFYLNCLKNIYSLLDLKKYGKAEELILSLSAYLSHIFRNIQSFISLREELDVSEKYVRLCQHLDRNVSLSLNLDNDSLSCRIPPMSILTFVENSIKHGDAGRQLEIIISVFSTGEKDLQTLHILVKNNGGPFESGTLQQLNTATPSEMEYREDHIGISNVRYRLWMIYRDKANLSFENEGECAVVKIELPYEKSQGGSYEYFNC